jgi:hypothetical protein
VSSSLIVVGHSFLLAAASAALIFFNYVVETTFLPVLAALVNVRA